jgi:hypothetical protein
MSPVAPQPELPTAEDLVAYLDGELAPEDCRRVEQRLAADEDYRQQLRDLDQAWEALDSLPTAKATDDFARTTMELVTVAAEGDASKVSATASKTRRSRLLWQIVAGAAAVALSFFIARAILPDPNRRLLQDLPVIRQAEALQLVPNVEFLRQLADEVPADSLMTDDEAANRELSHIKLISTDSPEARRSWVESQSAEQKAKLAAAAKRFAARTPGERERLIKLQREISRADDSQKLQEMLVAYGQWLDGLTAGKQEQLREEMAELSTDEQVERVRQFVRGENAQASRQLSNEDAERLRREVLAIAAERQGELSREMRRRGERDRARRLEGPEGALMIVTRELSRDRNNDEVRDRLVDTLSPNARAHLDRLNRDFRRGQLWQWVRQSLQTKVGPHDLERFFAEKLENSEREKLLNMPADEMQWHLERLYFAAELGSGEATPWWIEAPNADDERRGPPGGREPDFPREGPRRDGPRRDRERGPGSPPREFLDRERMPPGPDGPRGPGGPRGVERPEGRPPRFDRPGPSPESPPPRGET